MNISDLQTWAPTIATVAAATAAIVGLWLSWSGLHRAGEINRRLLEELIDLRRGGDTEDTAAWAQAVVEGLDHLDGRQDRAILAQVLTDLRAQMDAIAKMGEVVLGSPELAREFEAAWKQHGEALDDAISQIQEDWTRVGPYMELAGLTGPSLQFKAQTVSAFFKQARLTVTGVSDGPPSTLEEIRELVRSGKLLDYLKSADVVWESAALALGVAAPLAVGAPPPTPAVAKLSKHGVTEVKKMTEAILERLRRK